MELLYENGELKIKINADQSVNEVFGTLDSNMNILREHYGVEIIQRQDEIILRGENAEKAVFAYFLSFSSRSRPRT